jgi:hypothetical protein
MSNRCHIHIRAIGKKEDIAAAEKDLAKVFGAIWDLNNSYDLTVTGASDGIVYNTWYPWGPPGDELDEVFESHPNLIFLTAFSETVCGFRGRCVWAYGYDAEYDEGPYGPDGDELYDQSHPLPDIFARYRDPATRPTPDQAKAEFAARTEANRAKRNTRLQEKAAFKAQQEAERQREIDRLAKEEAARKTQEALDEQWFLVDISIWPRTREEAAHIVQYIRDHPDECYSSVAERFGWKLTRLVNLLKYYPAEGTGSLFDERLVDER